jgi:Kef-type K+ transport system membrane component KefB
MNFKPLKPAAKYMLLGFGLAWMLIFITVGLIGEASTDLVSIAAAVSYFFAWFWIIFTPIAFALGYFFVPADANEAEETPAQPRKRGLFHR